MATLPLFPLGTVLLPGGAAAHCRSSSRATSRCSGTCSRRRTSARRVFGVVAIREGYEVGEDGVRALHPVGCAALLTQAAALEGERFLVVSVGTDRFRLDGIEESAGTPYATGRRHLADEPDGDDRDVTCLAARVARGARSSSPRSWIGTEPELPSDDRPCRMPCRRPCASTWQTAKRSSRAPTRSRACASASSSLSREREFAAALGAVSRPPHPPLNLN